MTETCLAMTIFRDEFDIQFVIVFTTLLFLKIFHWLCQDRVEYVSIVRTGSSLCSELTRYYFIDGADTRSTCEFPRSYDLTHVSIVGHRLSISQSCHLNYHGERPKYDDHVWF